ncbi:nuclear factor 7, brain-like [Clupea harengus]|uniref:Nuclear factor 7, brain-like n=1 Tax=Clupea harengus TaxID=7950 RepID=A0A6P8G8R8_CLUHA|nr:nuclear factor 7, brain-like [Clupea harengus]
MASEARLPEKNQACAVCCETHEDVLLLCGHQVCKSCLQLTWRGSYQCTVCGGVSNEEDLLCGSGGKRQRDVPLQKRPQRATEGSEVLCARHGENAKYLCLEEKLFLCDVCQDLKEHENHKCCPIHEAALELKKELEILQEDLGGKLEILKDIKDAYVCASEHIVNQANYSEQRIKEEFAKLHQFLWDEEASRIATLKEEEEQKSQAMKDQIDQMSKEILSLSNTIRAIEEEMRAEDDVPLQHPEGIGSGGLVNVAKHVGNLGFRIWEKMKDMVQCTPVMLDPNTADSRLCISADLTSVKIRDEAVQLPDNPERYDMFACVLGSQGFASGTPSWVVEVEENTSWEVGVSSEASQRKGEAIWAGVWSVEFWDEEYYSRSPGQLEKTRLQVNEKLRRIKVRLDWDGGKMSFSDAVSGAHLLTLTHTFTEEVFPFFYNGCDIYPLSVLPGRHSLKVED